MRRTLAPCRAGDQLIFEINSDEIRQFEVDWMSMDAEAHQSRLAHCAGHVPGDGSSYASGSVLVCTRTSGCTKQAGHQGFCSGHKGFNKRKGEDGYFEKGVFQCAAYQRTPGLTECRTVYSPRAHAGSCTLGAAHTVVYSKDHTVVYSKDQSGGDGDVTALIDKYRICG